MLIVEEISKDVMIGEFLKAELHSSRFREGSLKALQMLGYGEMLLENPSYDYASQNLKRAKVLGLCRGWPDKDLFASFPNDTRWFTCSLTVEELNRCYRLKSQLDMTDEERLLLHTAQAVSESKRIRNIDNQLIRDIADAIKNNSPIPPIVLVTTSIDAKKVLIEGHSRSTAYCLTNTPRGITSILGISSNMSSWEYY